MNKPIAPSPRHENDINASDGSKYFLLSLFFLPVILILLKIFVG